MLKKLIIKNFALIDNLAIDFHPGFNALTGETGAGKSIIIDAVDIVIGGQGLAEFIRSGENTALIEAFFEISNNDKVKDILEKLELIPDETEYLILSREIVRTGKNLTRINGRSVTLSVYREVTKNLVDIYGQHHQQSLLDPQKHIELADVFGGEEVMQLRNKVAQVYYELSDIEIRLKQMDALEKDQARMADVYRFQFDEIENSRLSIGEDLALEAEKKILIHSEKLTLLSAEAYEILYAGQTNASDLINEAVRHLKDIAAIDAAAAEMYENLQSALYQVEDLSRDIKAYGSNIEHDPERLQEVDNRIQLLNQLKKKYGDTIQEIIEYQKQIASSMEAVENWEEKKAMLAESFEKKKVRYYDLADKLTAERGKIAVRLNEEITSQLKELNIPHVSFKVDIRPKESIGSQGVDNIEFMISPNVGEPLKPLSKIVSGGEVSRIMLAFKTILSAADSVSTMIFDEVDAGVGGIALQAVAKKLSHIGNNKQVICVTHSPHIAAYADNHYKIEKSVENERTITKINLLTYEQRVQEIARMLSGDKITEVTTKHAEEILKCPNN